MGLRANGRVDGLEGNVRGLEVSVHNSLLVEICAGVSRLPEELSGEERPEFVAVNLRRE